MSGSPSHPEDGPAARAPTPAVAVPLTVGVGTSRGCPPAELLDLLDASLAEAGLPRGRVGAVASADVKADEPAVLELAAVLGVPARFLPADVLAAVTVPTPSAVVAAAVGTPSVAEASALIVSGDGDARRARLLVTKRRSAHATCAIAAPAAVISGTDRPVPRRIVTATDDCRGCGGCIGSCPEHALVPVGARRGDGTLALDGGIPLLTLADRCNGCGECLEICPVDAFIEVSLP